MARARASRKKKEVAAPVVEEEVEEEGVGMGDEQQPALDLDNMEDIRRDIETKCSALQAFAEEAALALRSELKIQLLKMPKKVRNMPLKDFLSNFAGDINKVIVDELNARFIQIENPPFEPKTAARGRGGRGRRGGAATTCKKAAAPSTVMATRTTRKRARDAAATAVEGTVLRTTRSRTRSMSMSASASVDPDPSQVLNSPNPRLVLKTPAPAKRSTRGAAAKTHSTTTTTGVARQPFTPLVTNTNPRAHLQGLGLPPDTVLRHAKKGEIFFSKNGSPLGMVAGSPAYDLDENEEEGEGAGQSKKTMAMMMTPMVGAGAGAGGKKQAKQWTSKNSTIKTCATVRCRTRTRSARTEEEAEAETEPQENNNSGVLSPEDLQILLTNEDGEEIDLDGSDPENLPVDIKSLALGKLMGLQNKVISMIASLGHAK